MTGGHDNYLDCSDYIGTPDANGFTRFESEGDYYFSLMENGKVILCSEGYQNEAGRENGIASVQKNMELEERYAVIQTESGKWALSLKAGNHKEVGRSCEVDSEAEAKAFLPSERAKANAARLSAMSNTTGTVTGNSSDSGEDDDYMICREYEEQFDASKMVDGIISFTHEKSGKFYFAWFNDNGQVILRSEGYPTASARDNGVESVIKNRDISERFANIEAKGAHFLILKAGNHKEIGRSCPKKSADEASGLWKAVAALGVVGIAANLNIDSSKVEVSALPVADIKVEAPKVDVPVADIKVEAPKVDAPVAEIKVEAPKVEVPVADIKVEAPKVEVPVPDIKVEAPKVEMSNSINTDLIKGAALTGAAAMVANNLKSTTVEDKKIVAPVMDADVEGSGFKWWWLLLLLLGALLLAFLFFKGCKGSNINSAVTEVVDTTAANMEVTIPVVDTTLDSAAIAAKAQWAILGDMMEMKLPDGSTIQVPANGDEKKLIDFLNGGCNGDLKKSWFNMDRVLFNTGSAELNEVSREQIDNLVTIFKAYPNATFKIGGYTDNVGSVASNKKLSGNRAMTAMNEIGKGGIDAKRMDSEGYGPENPVCAANDTDECKAKNRRVALRVTKCN
jgi:outer membrane protein OmpA-like peptidoglycan-associated protein/uncharacterized protein YegP (UPF0339 family)